MVRSGGLKGKVQNKKIQIPYLVTNLYSERELPIKLLLGEKNQNKNQHMTISGPHNTHTYIKLTLFLFFYFAPFPKWLLGQFVCIQQIFCNIYIL